MKNLIILFSVMVATGLTTMAQNSKKEAKEQKKEEQYQQIIELVQSESYAFEGRKANPQKGPQVDLTTRSNFLRIDSGNATADMPYFGRAYSGGYSAVMEESNLMVQWSPMMFSITKRKRDSLSNSKYKEAMILINARFQFLAYQMHHLM